MPHTIQPLYKAMTKRLGDGTHDLKSDDMSHRLANLIVAGHGYLETTVKSPLISGVPGKSYFMFNDSIRSKTSRPVNRALYMEDINRNTIDRMMSCDVVGWDAEYITKVIYTCAMTYCCSADLLKTSDQKTPGTYFEVLIGHLVARVFDVNPKNQITVPTLDMTVTLPTDFIFDLGPGNNRIHLPTKISTRERVVQVWAHQRVLDGMHGVARFKGVLVAVAETNKQENKSVVEVCLPNQWVAYQMYIAQMHRVYYLDIPEKYLNLKDTYPFLQVKQFGEFFFEAESIRKSSAAA